jgi:hypothetical protein
LHRRGHPRRQGFDERHPLLGEVLGQIDAESTDDRDDLAREVEGGNARVCGLARTARSPD